MSMIRVLTFSLAAALAGCSATSQDRSTGQVVDDAGLTARVKQQLIEEDNVSAAAVNVTTYRGVVQLSGFVESAEARRRAENAARDVEGVSSVLNDLRIAPAGSGR